MNFPGAGSSGGNGGAAGLRFNPAPGWPRPPADWVPPEGWQPDPAWPPAPEGWSFWVPDPDAAGAPGAPAPADQDDSEIRVSLGGQSFTIRPGQEIRIGRAPENDMVVPEPTVSRQHGVVRRGPGGWEFAQAGSAPTFLNGQPVTQVAVDRALELALGGLDGPRLTLEPAEGTRRLPAVAPDPSWRQAGGLASAAGGAPGWPAPPGGRQSGYPSPAYPSSSWGAPPAWGNSPPVRPPGHPGDDMGNALRILFPVHSWLHNSGWRQGLRLGVIVYALLPLIFLTVLSSSTSLSAPGWAYSLYVAPLWLIGFWLLIRPPDRPGKQEIVIAAAIVVWTFAWLNTVTIAINDALPISKGIDLLSALVIGLNEETSKALPVLLAGLILWKFRKVKLDVRMWMIFGTIAGLTFGVTEQAIYTSSDIVIIAQAHSPNDSGPGHPRLRRAGLRRRVPARGVGGHLRVLHGPGDQLPQAALPADRDRHRDARPAARGQRLARRRLAVDLDRHPGGVAAAVPRLHDDGGVDRGHRPAQQRVPRAVDDHGGGPAAGPAPAAVGHRQAGGCQS